MVNTLTKKTIGLYGVTANPPHFGHMKVINTALDSCDEVWVSPVWIHPFGKKFADYNVRLEMLQKILNDFIFKKLISVKLKELDKQYHDLHGKTPFSYDLLSFAKSMNSEYDFKLIIGEDNYLPEVWSKFYKHKEIESDFGLIVVKDEGVHSTQIRELCKLKKYDEVKSLVGNDVLSVILGYRLYY